MLIGGGYLTAWMQNGRSVWPGPCDEPYLENMCKRGVQEPRVASPSPRRGLRPGLARVHACRKDRSGRGRCIYIFKDKPRLVQGARRSIIVIDAAPKQAHCAAAETK